MPRTTYGKHWSLDPAVIFLNHGSFGACPRPVLERQRQLRDRLEAQPLRFFVQEIEPLLDQARQALAAFVGAEPENLAFVPNATTGVNTVLRSRCSGPDRLQPGDELLTTNHGYNACNNALRFLAEQTGARIVVAEVPFPLAGPEAVVAAVMAQVTDRTRLALLDHVTSQTGLIFPLETLVPQLTAAGVETLIDGAHAPGMIPLDLRAIAPTYYTGNAHKWLCCPKGSAFLYVHPDRHENMRPLTISHGANSPRRDRSRFWLEFDWPGTVDPTPYLCVPEAIAFLGSLLPGGWPALMQHNHAKAIAARDLLCRTLGVAAPCPDDMLGTLASVALPDGDWQSLQAVLLDQFQIEVPIVPWPTAPRRWVRISAQIYNDETEYAALAEALTVTLAQERSGSPIA